MTTITTRQLKATPPKQSQAPKSSPKHQQQVLSLLTARPKGELAKTIRKYVATASNKSGREARLSDVAKLFSKDLIPDDIIKWAASKKELEVLWKENKKKLVVFFSKCRELGERPPTLRGPDLVGELARLAAMTKDERFTDALKALAEHGIIDNKFNFKRRQLPSVVKAEAEVNGFMLWGIRALIEQGASIRRACAEMAALGGPPAASFDAAIKQLQLLYASAEKKGAR